VIVGSALAVTPVTVLPAAASALAVPAWLAESGGTAGCDPPCRPWPWMAWETPWTAPVPLATEAAGEDGAWVTVAALDPAPATAAGALAVEAAGAGEAAPETAWLAELGGTADCGAAGWP
jgi:hypothetical protein